MAAARYLGVPPWELQQQPTMWRDIALQAQAAEHGARQAKREAEKRRQDAMSK